MSGLVPTNGFINWHDPHYNTGVINMNVVVPTLGAFLRRVANESYHRSPIYID